MRLLPPDQSNTNNGNQFAAEILNYGISKTASAGDKDLKMEKVDFDSEKQNMYTKCKTALISIVAHSTCTLDSWNGDDETMNSVISSVLGWCLLDLSALENMPLTQQFLKYLKTLLENSSAVRSIFLENTARVRLMLVHLVGLYEGANENDLMGQGDKEAVIKLQIQDALNQVLLLIVDHVQKQDAVESTLVSVMKRPDFQSAVKYIQGNSKSECSNRLALMLQEMLLGCKIFCHATS